MPCRRRSLLWVPLLLLPVAAAGRATAAPAPTPPAELARLWPQVHKVGQGRLRFLGLAVYDAHLWSPARPGPEDWAQQPFALELVYARDLKGLSVAERSLVEMRRQGPLGEDQAERWLATMRETFPDLRSGDRLSGVHRPGEPAQFHHNGELRAQWADAALVRRFFGIWLAPQTSQPALREALFGGRA